MKFYYQQGLSFVVAFDLFNHETEYAKIMLGVLINLSKDEQAKECFEKHLKEIEEFEQMKTQ